MAEEPSIIIDNGSCYIKSGFDYEREPMSIISSSVGQNNKYKKWYDDNEFYIGSEAVNKYGLLDFKYPMKRNIIKD